MVSDRARNPFWFRNYNRRCAAVLRTLSDIKPGLCFKRTEEKRERMDGDRIPSGTEMWTEMSQEVKIEGKTRHDQPLVLVRTSSHRLRGS